MSLLLRSIMMSFVTARGSSIISRGIVGNKACRFMSVITLSDQDATEKFRKMNSKSILYFTATWCPPCKMISPEYEKLSKTHSDVAFGKVDVDDNGDAAMDFEISAVPTFVFFHGDTVVNRFSGADTNALEKQIIALKDS